MSFFEFIVLVAAGMATIITCVTLILKSGERKNENDIKQVCKEKFSDIEDTNTIRRNACMAIFQTIKNSIQSLMLQNTGFERDIKNLTEKIDELKIDVKKISEFVMQDSKKNKRR